MASKSKCIQVANNVDPLAKSKPLRIPSDVRDLPADYPFFNAETGFPLVSESLADYARRKGEKLNTIRKQADRELLPILQGGKRGHRRVNLYALYLQARYQAERYVAQTCCQTTE